MSNNTGHIRAYEKTKLGGCEVPKAHSRTPYLFFDDMYMTPRMSSD